MIWYFHTRMIRILSTNVRLSLSPLIFIANKKKTCLYTQAEEEVRVTTAAATYRRPFASAATAESRLTASSPCWVISRGSGPGRALVSAHQEREREKREKRRSDPSASYFLVRVLVLHKTTSSSRRSNQEPEPEEPYFIPVNRKIPYIQRHTAAVVETGSTTRTFLLQVLAR